MGHNVEPFSQSMRITRAYTTIQHGALVTVACSFDPPLPAATKISWEVAPVAAPADTSGLREEFNRGWRQAESEIAAAIGGNDFEHLHAGKLWVEKLKERERVLRERVKVLRERALKLTTAMETCHICGTALLVDEGDAATDRKE